MSYSIVNWFWYCATPIDLTMMKIDDLNRTLLLTITQREKIWCDTQHSKIVRSRCTCCWRAMNISSTGCISPMHLQNHQTNKNQSATNQRQSRVWMDHYSLATIIIANRTMNILSDRCWCWCCKFMHIHKHLQFEWIGASWNDCGCFNIISILLNWVMTKRLRVIKSSIQTTIQSSPIQSILTQSNPIQASVKTQTERE